MHKFVRYLALAFAALALPVATHAQQPAPTQTPTLIPATFNPPTLIETPHFKLVPLGPAVVKLDFDAYMSSVEHLQKTFSRSTNWPHAGISDADAMLDMQTEEGRFKARKSFAYSVLTPDGRSFAAWDVGLGRVRSKHRRGREHPDRHHRHAAAFHAAASDA